MNNQLNIYVLNRADLAIKSFGRSFNYEINRDYLTNEKSTFAIDGGYAADQGDFLLAKTFGVDNSPEYNSRIGGSLRPLFFGVIDSFENDNIVACDLYNITNFNFAATRKTGSASAGGFGVHLLNLLNVYLDSSKLVSRLNFSVDDSAKVAYSYQPADPPTITNMVDYLINGFKKYNITLEIDSIYYDPQDSNNLNVNVIIKRKTKQIQLKNNSYDFLNWDVYENTGGRDSENELLIINKTSTDSENPIILGTYYITKDGTITQSINDNVYKPTKTKIYIYDDTQTDLPSLDEIANSELSASSSRSHEINFDLRKDNNFLSITDLEIGLLVNIVYNNTIYDSVLTGYLISSENNFISLKFGNTRSTLREVLNNQK